MVNGTITIEVALRAADIGWGDEVIVPAYTFSATAAAPMAAGPSRSSLMLTLTLTALTPRQLKLPSLQKPDFQNTHQRRGGCFG